MVTTKITLRIIHQGESKRGKVTNGESKRGEVTKKESKRGKATKGESKRGLRPLFKKSLPLSLKEG